ncbi:MAG: hypothetical protein GY757_00045 [bacterium]|nr:hypothetical protein [bacterium]
MELSVEIIAGIIIVTFLAFKGAKWISKAGENEASYSDDVDFGTLLRSQRISNKAKREQDDYTWLPPGERINIAGYEIPGGMIYYGKHMKSLSRQDAPIEPGFINISLPISKNNPARAKKKVKYFPTYSELAGTGRIAYLEWLEGDRKDPDVNISYVLIFFYGLERRLLHDASNGKVSHSETQLLIAELKRLRDLYGNTNNSFDQYVNGLLDYLLLEESQEKYYNLEPSSCKYTYAMSVGVKLALGQLVKEGKPLDGKWMYQYVIHHPEINLRTPAERCPDEFRKLFLIRFQKVFSKGILLKPNRTKIRLNYFTANVGLRNKDYRKRWDIPDVSILKSLENKLKPLLDDCQDSLDKYSRWLGLHPEQKDSIIAYSLLPDDIAGSIENKEARAFSDLLSRRFKEKEEVLVSNKELLRKWPVKTPGKMKKSEMIAFSDLLRKMGFGIEPDVRFDGKAIKEAGHSVLFKMPEMKIFEPSPEYLSKTLLLTLSAAVANADGYIAVDEEKFLLSIIEDAGTLETEEKIRLHAHLTWFIKSRTAISGLKRKLETIDTKRKHHLAECIIAIAGADGYVSPAEVKALTKFYKLLGFQEKDVYSDIHAFQVDKNDSEEQPVSVRAADTDRNGYAIPQPKPTNEKGFKLDRDKIKNKIAETAAVSAILSDVFEEDQEEEIVEPQEESSESIHGLDLSHTAVLLAFQKQAAWPRKEFERLVAKFDLLPDGTIDVINETALEICDDILCEGEEIIEINQEILEELLK